MSQEWKLIVERAATELERHKTPGAQNRALDLRNLLAAAPVPPAGGEVEVLGYRIDSDTGHRFSDAPSRGHGLKCTELVDRAHVTRLQAEVERLTETDSAYDDAICASNELGYACSLTAC